MTAKPTRSQSNGTTCLKKATASSRGPPDYRPAMGASPPTPMRPPPTPQHLKNVRPNSTVDHWKFGIDFTYSHVMICQGDLIFNQAAETAEMEVAG